MRLIKNILFSLIVCILFFLTLEGGFRIYKFVKTGNNYWLYFGLPRSPKEKEKVLPMQKGLISSRLFRHISDSIKKNGYYIYKAGIYYWEELLDVKDKRITINSFGFRGRELPRLKPNGVTRIACLGESAVFGMFLDDRETFPFILEECLGENFQVINAGLPGQNSTNILACFKNEILPLKPDMVILYFGVNDHSAVVETKKTWYYLNKFFYEKVHGFLYYNKSALYTCLAEKLSLLFTGNADVSKDILTNLIYDQAKVQNIVSLYSNNVQDLIRLCLKVGIRPYLVTQPLLISPQYANFSEYNKVSNFKDKQRISWAAYPFLVQCKLLQELRRIGGEFNIPVIDAAGDFDKIHYLKRTQLFFDMAHLTPEGNRIVGNIICNYLKKDMKR